jgi:peptidoglycan/LPS O-acetylase OafA/YrhL
MICVGLALDKTLFPRLIGTKPFIFLGDISYSMYMWQFPVFFWFTHILGVENLGQGQFFVFLVSLITLSAISFKWIEEPIRKSSSKQKSAD